VKKFAGFLGLVAVLTGGAFLFVRGPVADTTSAALRAYPVYAVIRARNDMLARAHHRGGSGTNVLAHRTGLSDAADRFVTTPNNDTLYSSAFLDLSKGPLLLTMPALPNRYHSAAIMDLRTDHALVAGTRDAVQEPQTLFISGPGYAGAVPKDARQVQVPTAEAWLLIRTLVDGPADLTAARAAQAGFVLTVPPESLVPERRGRILPVTPDPATLLAMVNPAIAENPALADTALADTGYGGAADAFETLPAWRQWLWRAVLPRMFSRMKTLIANGSRKSGDGWSQTPPGIGTAAADDTVRAGVALAGLAALPATEAVYWSATQDDAREELTGARRYSLHIPADMPKTAFWSVSMYERMADGRLFYAANPIDRFAIGDRTPDMARNADGSLTLTLAHEKPGKAANWLPAPPGEFTIIYRAYLPAPALQQARWRLPPVKRLD